ncbi:response regulator [Maribacter sp. CXY002]|uniref:response regulator n=1 Tax=Maribacter luteocoastalis TaxID=3407671 RepID=UPI003B674465
MIKLDSCCIIDDDEFFSFNTKKLMKENGFCDNILQYTDGQKAIDGLIGLLIENIPLPEVILLDLNMPNKNGWEFLEEFSGIPMNQRLGVKIYIVSSFVSPDNLAKAKTYDMVEQYIMKPFTVTSLDKITVTKKAS